MMSLQRKIMRILLVALCCIGLSGTVQAQERIKDLVSIAGVRNNQLVGYGLVVGLDGSGDQTTQSPFTLQSVANLLGNMGVTIPAGTNMQPKNIAAVIVTADLPPFSRSGQAIDVTVSSIGNAKSLRGGTLIMTPLKGADGQVYAMAQGNMLVGGAGAAAGGAAQTINHLSAGRIPKGATVERTVPTVLGEGEFVMLELHDFDFSTADRVVQAINQATGQGVAQAIDGRSIRVLAPMAATERVAFLGRLENLTVTPQIQSAKVIVNSRTGSVVMNQKVTLQNAAVAHGNLSVTIQTAPVISQPAPFGSGQTVVTQIGQVDIDESPTRLLNLPASANLAEVVRALNMLGATPTDLISILQALKASGALRADLEVI